MKKTIIPILVGVAVILVVGLLVILNLNKKDTIYNDSLINGNSAGNLYNQGLFCEKDGVIYFANPDDHYTLYSMELDGQKLKKLNNDVAKGINADEHYVYYVRDNGNTGSYSFDTFVNSNTNSLCRYDLKTKKVKVLDEAPSLYPVLVGNNLYYLHYDKKNATSFYTVGIDGKNLKMVSDEYMFTCNAIGSYIYYNDMAYDGSIYRYDTSSDSYTVLYEANTYKPIVISEENTYYLDVDHDNRLMHINLDSPNPVVVTEDSIDLYNVYGSYIYYVAYTKNGSSLCRIKNDGSEFEVIAEGAYNTISATSNYIYVTEYGTNKMYRFPTTGTAELEEYHPGIDTKYK